MVYCRYERAGGWGGGAGSLLIIITIFGGRSLTV